MNAKELILAKLNAVPGLVDIYTYLISLGTDVDTICDVMVSDAFNYITKIYNGNIFNKVGSGTTLIENTVKFYIGNDTLGVDRALVSQLLLETNSKNGELFDNDEVKIMMAKIDSVIRTLLSSDQQTLTEELERLAEYRAQAAIEGKNIPLRLIEYSVEELRRAKTLLEECLERNYKRSQYKQSGNNLEDLDTKLGLLADRVIPGVKEQQQLGTLAGLNQGLKTKSWDKFKFKQGIEVYITGLYAQSEFQFNEILSHYNDWLNNVERELSSVEFSDSQRNRLLKQQAQYRNLLNTIISKEGSPNRFDLYRFVTDTNYRESWIDVMNVLKVSDNILEIITTVPHFKEMLNTWAVDETLLRKASTKYNSELAAFETLRTSPTQRFNEFEYNQIKSYINDKMILGWLFDRNFSIRITDLDKLSPGVKNSDGSQIVSNTLTLDSIENIETFKHLVESWIVPVLKDRYPDNEFIQSLSPMIEPVRDGYVKSFLKLPIQMMEVDQSVELQSIYNGYISGLNEVALNEFAGMRIGDIFYLYNLIVNKDSFGNNSMTRLFEDLVNSSDANFLVNDYHEWIGNMDATQSADNPIILKSDDFLKDKIVTNVKKTKVVGNKLEQVISPDTTFEVSRGTSTVNKITSTIPRLGVRSRTRVAVPVMSLLTELFPTQEINVSETSGHNIHVLTESDWDSIRDDNNTVDSYFKENESFLRKQKSFIFNGKLYVNYNNADISDLVHEWAHIILAKLKWATKEVDGEIVPDETKRKQYYEIVSKVIDHPKFNDIAQHYPWAHGSDLQEEVLTNLFQMYIQNKVFTQDNILEELVKIQPVRGNKSIETASYESIIKFVETAFNLDINKELSVEDAPLSDLIQIFGGNFYSDYLADPNKQYVLSRHQEVQNLKNQLIKKDLLTIKCD